MRPAAEPVRRTRNPWGEGERLRTEILEAASGLLSELGGEAGLSIRGVARATGVAPGSIYQHFRDLNTLADHLHEYECERLLALLERAGADHADPVERLRAQLVAYCDFALANPGHYRILFRPPNRGNPPPDPLTTPLGQVVNLFVAGFERCREAGLDVRLSNRDAGTMVFSSMHGRVAIHLCYGTGKSREQLALGVDQLLSLLVGT
ncbi:TetR/AcrR family transcriptional regulator [Pseudonocardia zijingensis]|jgi:AcrR family transcriptional regulator|uniref:TetR/AcrR family transcriptional regulator n=1 Tax=Pseudonocardia zijingensis TaxID=153376 RepID=A0ABP3YTS5_9PSEU